MTTPSTHRGSRPGLFGKYYGLRRSRDDSLVEDWYFVLKIHDPHAQAALLAYADSIEPENAILAGELREAVRDERLVEGLYEASWER